MKKLESTLTNMLLALTGITVVMVGILAFMNELTREPIAQANAKTLSDAVAAVVPGFDNDPIAEKRVENVEGVDYTIYPATKGGEYLGAAVESTALGFGGNLTIIVGFDKDGVINDYSLLNHAETPGLGAKADQWFKKGQKGDITGKTPANGDLTVSKDGGQIDAITASTITSRAFLKAVNNAYKVYKGSPDAVSGATQSAN
ncbi:MAG: RnfABCDGE type electron transport complex subunit G [Bacteroidaceae bacterium]|jgi:electron transport complex protein RnfG|nr:RnfABCDGE type electron transport complex subunit G [Bacteroidaceae bacterium]